MSLKVISMNTCICVTIGSYLQHHQLVTGTSTLGKKIVLHFKNGFVWFAVLILSAFHMCLLAHSHCLNGTPTHTSIHDYKPFLLLFDLCHKALLTHRSTVCFCTPTLCFSWTYRPRTVAFLIQSFDYKPSDQWVGYFHTIPIVLKVWERPQFPSMWSPGNSLMQCHLTQDELLRQPFQNVPKIPTSIWDVGFSCSVKGARP